MKPIRPQKRNKVRGRVVEKKPLSMQQSIQAKKRLTILLHSFLCMVFLGVIIFVFLFSSFMQIKKINLEGLEDLSHADVESVMMETYEGKYLGILPKDNYCLFPDGEIAKILKERFRKISEVSVEKRFPDEAVVKIKERDSLLLWCSGGPCYLVDESGFAYMGVDFSSPDIEQNRLIKIIDTSAKPLAIGDKVLSREYIDFVLAAVNRFPKESGMELLEEGNTPSRLAGEISFISKDGAKIALSTDLPLDQTMKTLNLFMQKELPEQKRAELDYLDLRFENRVYYKLKGGEQEIEAGGDGSDDSMVAGEEISKESVKKDKDKRDKKD